MAFLPCHRQRDLKQKSIQAVIFDMDGVIVDSEPLHERAYREIFREMGYGDAHGIHFPDYYGKTDRALWVDFIARHRPLQSIDELLAWKQTRLIDLLRVEKPVFEGLPDLAEKLAAYYPLAIASGSAHPVIDEVLAIRQLRRFFSVLVSSTDVPNGKPAPDIFLRAASLLEVPPANCVVVEDSIAGVEGAVAAGMQVVAIANTISPDQLARATKVVHTYEEIGRLLLPQA
jgi:HAD superfamily hydrolase (TIGR01549 family)